MRVQYVQGTGTISSSDRTVWAGAAVTITNNWVDVAFQTNGLTLDRFCVDSYVDQSSGRYYTYQLNGATNGNNVLCLGVSYDTRGGNMYIDFSETNPSQCPGT